MESMVSGEDFPVKTVTIHSDWSKVDPVTEGGRANGYSEVVTFQKDWLDPQ